MSAADPGGVGRGPDANERLTVLYDGSCRFCTRVAARLAGLDRDRRLRFVPLQAAESDLSEVAALAAERDLGVALHVVDGAGRWAHGGAAMLAAMERVPALAPLARICRTPPLDRLVEPAYRFAAGHRRWLAWLAGDFRGPTAASRPRAGGCGSSQGVPRWRA